MENTENAKYPVISYTHILSELSVNRKDPCEVIRELISNSYDANAKNIEIYPLLQERGFIYFDDGIGLDEDEEINGITPYLAFFSIGKSTKTQGESIGYKCQGSKLCFASKKITVITKCQNALFWRYISIDNPKNNLNEKFDVSSKDHFQPWEVINKLFPKLKAQTKNVIEQLNQEFFLSKFKTQGTMIIVEGLQVEDFANYYSSDDYGKETWSYLKHYIRFNTRHSDMRILRPADTGFAEKRAISFEKTVGYNEECKLFLWSKKKIKYSLEEIKAGYPYLNKPDQAEESKIKSPSQISSLNNGNFSSRYCSTFLYEETTYCITLAIDGHKRALTKYEELSRKGKKISGIRLADQRGVFLSSEGVRICHYNEIFEDSSLKEYSLLSEAKAQSHYILIINGSFDVVTNRNAITDTSRQILKNPVFLAHIEKFLDEAKKQLPVFRELIERLNKENQEERLEAYTQKFRALKKGVQNRNRFKVKNIIN